MSAPTCRQCGGLLLAAELYDVENAESMPARKCSSCSRLEYPPAPAVRVPRRVISRPSPSPGDDPAADGLPSYHRLVEIVFTMRGDFAVPGVPGLSNVFLARGLSRASVPGDNVLHGAAGALGVAPESFSLAPGAPIRLSDGATRLPRRTDYFFCPVPRARIVAQMRRAGIRAIDLAARMHLSNQRLSQFLKPDPVGGFTAARLALAMDLPADAFASTDDSGAPDWPGRLTQETTP